MLFIKHLNNMFEFVKVVYKTILWAWCIC